MGHANKAPGDCFLLISLALMLIVLILFIPFYKFFYNYFLMEKKLRLTAQ